MTLSLASLFESVLWISLKFTILFENRISVADMIGYPRVSPVPQDLKLGQSPCHGCSRVEENPNFSLSSVMIHCQDISTYQLQYPSHPLSVIVTICVCVYVFLFTYACVCIYIYLCVYLYLCTYVCMCVCVCRYNCGCMCIHVCVCGCMCVYSGPYSSSRP